MSSFRQFKDKLIPITSFKQYKNLLMEMAESIPMLESKKSKELIKDSLYFLVKRYLLMAPHGIKFKELYDQLIKEENIHIPGYPLDYNQKPSDMSLFIFAPNLKTYIKHILGTKINFKSNQYLESELINVIADVTESSVSLPFLIFRPWRENVATTEIDWAAYFDTIGSENFSTEVEDLLEYKLAKDIWHLPNRWHQIPFAKPTHLDYRECFFNFFDKKMYLLEISTENILEQLPAANKILEFEVGLKMKEEAKNTLNQIPYFKDVKQVHKLILDYATDKDAEEIEKRIIAFLDQKLEQDQGCCILRLDDFYQIEKILHPEIDLDFKYQP